MAWNYLTFVIYLVAAFAGTLAVAYPTPVDFDGELLRWDIGPTNPTVLWEVKADQADILPFFEQVVTDSARLWSTVPGSYLKLTRAPEGAFAQITFDFKYTQLVGESAAGSAEFDEIDKSGPIHCAVNIGGSPQIDWTTIAKTALHEMGHCLGLGHSLVQESIMSYALDKNKFGLTIDDEAVVTRLYPKDASQTKLPPGCAVLGDGPWQAPVPGFTWGALIPLIFCAGLSIYSFALASKRPS
ncbi:MAG: matrixin family metalloprotease [Proteobacteria bacterium]|nr:matrixin family metalloprotease [Pseudomonadota bacterium]